MRQPTITIQFESEILDLIDNAHEIDRSDIQGIVTVLVNKIMDEGQNITYKLISQSLWRSGFIKDKNKVRQESREKMRRLIATDLASTLGNTDKGLNKEQFVSDCLR